MHLFTILLLVYLDEYFFFFILYFSKKFFLILLHKDNKLIWYPCCTIVEVHPHCSGRCAMM